LPAGDKTGAAFLLSIFYECNAKYCGIIGKNALRTADVVVILVKENKKHP
jgi:hypothetical protein